MSGPSDQLKADSSKALPWNLSKPSLLVIN